MSDPRRSERDHACPEVPGGLDDQQCLVAEAILLVSRGGSPRVTITGLRDGDLILEASRAIAAASGVRLISLPAADRSGADVRVEPFDLVGVESSDPVRGHGLLRAFRPTPLALARGPDQGT